MIHGRRSTQFTVTRAIVSIGGLASIAHFADNATSMGRYPEPSWITPLGVWGAWIPVAALCVYLLRKRQHDLPFRIGAFIFAIVLVSGTLHFAYGSIFTMSPMSTGTVLAEAACGLALLGALWRESWRARATG